MKHNRVLNIIKPMSSTISQSSIRTGKMPLRRQASQGHGTDHSVYKAVGSGRASFPLCKGEDM